MALGRSSIASSHLVPTPTLYPDEIAAAVREAERWGDVELQDLGRRLPWGAMHFRPEALGDVWRQWAARWPRALTSRSATYTAPGATTRSPPARLHDDLAGLPAKLAHVDALVAEGVIGGERATAADLQIGATIRVLLTVGDLQPLIEGRPLEAVARRWFPEYRGEIPAGAFPAGWVPSSS